MMPYNYFFLLKMIVVSLAVAASASGETGNSTNVQIMSQPSSISNSQQEFGVVWDSETKLY